MSLLCPGFFDGALEKQQGGGEEIGRGREGVSVCAEGAGGRAAGEKAGERGQVEAWAGIW